TRKRASSGITAGSLISTSRRAVVASHTSSKVCRRCPSRSGTCWICSRVISATLPMPRWASSATRRSIVASWITTIRPSAVGRRSSSISGQPACSASWNAVIVFSRAWVMAPRWPTIVISAVVVSGPVSVLVMGTILSGSRRDGGLFAAHAVAVAVQVRAVSRIALAHGCRAGRPGRVAVRVVHAAVAAALCGGGLRSRRRGGLRPTGLLLLRGDHVALARPGPGVAVALEGGEALAAAEHALHRVGFGGFDPEVVLRLHRDLPRHVLAAVVLLRRQPGRGIASALLPVQARLDRQQVQRVVGELAARVLAPARGAGLPCVGQRHHVVDVDGAVR